VGEGEGARADYVAQVVEGVRLKRSRAGWEVDYTSPIPLRE